MKDYRQLPPNLPQPQDDGAADHLPGAELISEPLQATNGEAIDLREPDLLVLYVYPRTGEPGEPSPPGWDDIPGARGCTPENCAFRDHAGDLAALGATVYGLSSQPIEEQQSFVEREHMPYPLLNDAELRLASDPGLPTFEAAGMTLYKRLTLVARRGRIEHVFYPVFPPDTHASEVVAWLHAAD